MIIQSSRKYACGCFFKNPDGSAGVNRVKRKSICVTAIPCVIIFKRAFEKYQLGAVASQVYERLNLTDSQFPGIMTASMIPSVFLSIVSGVLVDRLDIKRVLGICFGVMALGYLLRPFAGSFPVMYAAMVLGGTFVMAAAYLTAFLFPNLDVAFWVVAILAAAGIPAWWSGNQISP